MSCAHSYNPLDASGVRFGADRSWFGSIDNNCAAACTVFSLRAGMHGTHLMFSHPYTIGHACFICVFSGRGQECGVEIHATDPSATHCWGMTKLVLDRSIDQSLDRSIDQSTDRETQNESVVSIDPQWPQNRLSKLGSQQLPKSKPVTLTLNPIFDVQKRRASGPLATTTTTTAPQMHFGTQSPPRSQITGRGN